MRKLQRYFDTNSAKEISAQMEMRQVYIIGAGLSGLAAAHFLMRDAGIKGERIHILEKEQLGGGALDGYSFEETGYLMRGDHKLDARCDCLMELMEDIPSPDHPGESLQEEYFKLLSDDPNYSLCRLTENHGEEVRSGSSLGLSDAGCMEVFKLLLSTDEDLSGKQVRDVFGEEVLASPFWLYLKTTYFFRELHSALELRNALLRRLGELSGLPDLSSISYLKYHIFDSLVAPLSAELKSAGVNLRYGVRVTDVAFDCARGRKRATRIDYTERAEDGCIDLKEEDLLFVTLGSCVENSSRGSKSEPAPYLREIHEGGSFDLWRKIALQDPSFGHPDAFLTRPEETTAMSATVTTSSRKIISYIKKICKRDPFSGRTVTGGFVTAQDSPWTLSWSVGRQPVFRGQEQGQCVICLMGLSPERRGEYVDKPMRDCTGDEICAEWLFHLGVPADQIDQLAGDEARTIPVIMPFFTAPLMPRKDGDRPEALVTGARNFAFMGQFASCGDEAALSAEYAVRSAMEAVYRLILIERELPSPCGDAFDLRVLFGALSALRDGRSLKDLDLKRGEKAAVRSALKMIRGTQIEKMMAEAGLL